MEIKVISPPQEVAQETSMALSREDKGDVKNALGKALANKVSKVTRDKFDIARTPDASKDLLAKSNRQKANMDFKFRKND